MGRKTRVNWINLSNLRFESRVYDNLIKNKLKKIMKLNLL